MRTLNTDINKNQTGEFFELSQGLDVDKFLVGEELAVQRSWVEVLSQGKYLNPSEAEAAHRAFNSFETEVVSGKYHWQDQDEDIHMAVERYVTEHAGDVGKKMHLGRSRNDLIATTLRLFVANSCDKVIRNTLQFVTELLKCSERDIDLIMPAQTHRQAAQPIRVSHWWNAHAVNFFSDLDRLKFAKASSLKYMPMGAGAVSGTHLNLDLNKVAFVLGFASPTLNSLQSTSDRDFISDFGSAVSMLGLHFSRLCEEIIYWTSTPVGLFKLPPAWSSGSSMMPNKRNPDAFEILRAKSKRLISKNHELMLNNISLPLGYASDLHEQKRTLLTMLQELELISNSFKLSINGLTLDTHRAKELLQQGHVLATDLSNHLVTEGMSFREAYKKTALEVSQADLKGQQVGLNLMDYEKSVELKGMSGGTAKAQVKKTIEVLKSQIK